MPENSPAFGLLLDVDGPIVSPVTRTIAIDSIADDLAALANAGIPVVFNTGRSDAFLREVVIPPMRAAGLRDGAPVFGIGEKGATWFSPSGSGYTETQVDERLSAPQKLGRAILAIYEEHFRDSMFFDETKLSMVSVEHRVEFPAEEFAAQQAEFVRLAQAAVDELGFGDEFQLAPSPISVDVEHRDVGKDVGAERALELLRAQGIRVDRWYTVGDSRSDYAMADYLHEHGVEVEFVDVRPYDGIPEVGYPVLTAEGLDDDAAGAQFFARWRDQVTARVP